jgi:myo-inositol-1(or 4)-monophosphatase
MKPTLEFMVALARQAGEILRAGQTQRLHIEFKGEIDLVTEMDRRSESFLLEQIHEHFPDHAILAEESGHNGAINEECNCMWHIDPLDGTVNYAHGLPIYTVSLAYEENGRVELGVVYAPALGECFSAQRGQGAWFNEQLIAVGQAPQLARSLLVTGFPYDVRTTARPNLAEYARFSLISQGVRRFGSAALDCCYVACGRFDGYWELDVKSYDIAAGALIAEEAGARVTTAAGQDNYLAYRTSILAANPILHPQMLAVLKELPAMI